MPGISTAASLVKYCSDITMVCVIFNMHTTVLCAGSGSRGKKEVDSEVGTKGKDGGGSGSEEDWSS